MIKACFLATLASLLLYSQAISGAEYLDQTYAELVELPSLKREEGERKYMLKAFGKEIELDLHRTEGLLPTNLPVHVYGEDEAGNPTVDDWTHRTESQQMYSDKKTGASLMVEDEDGQTKMSGMLGDGMIIEPVKDDGDDDEKVEEVSKIRHLVYKSKNNKTTPVHNGISEEEEAELKKRAILPSELYVPIEVVVDYGLWKKMATTEDKVIKYIKQFYNSVNQIFSTLSWPSVAISIYGIQICKTASACNMIESIKVDATSVDVSKILGNVAKYAYDQKSTIGTNYALMMVMTDYDLCRPQPDGSCESGTVSTAPLGTACARYQFGTTAKIGVSEDHGVFSHVRIVANNIGRLLGMMRDGERAGVDGVPADAGGPGAAACRFTDNYVMGDTSHLGNKYSWSKCSVAQLRWFSIQPKAACLHVRPEDPVHRIISALPGKELSLDNQCKVLFGIDSAVQCRLPGINSGNDDLCQGLACRINPTTCRSKGPPADGSYCGPQRHCIKGKCVCDPNAPLPTPLPKDPTCNGDHFWMQFNDGKSCYDIFREVDITAACSHELMKLHCCESRRKHCSPTPITCDAPAATVKTTPPSDGIFTVTPYPTRRPFVDPTDITCGKPCRDSPVDIGGKNCAQLLSSSADKTKLCDHPIIMQHCCRTRANVCRGYHRITNSCDTSCEDDPKQTINHKHCVELLSTAEDRENFCHEPLVKQHCCATRWKVCPHETPFGK